MMRRSMWAAVILSMASTAQAQNAPRFVRLSYASADTMTRMGITWNSDSGGAQVVQYGVSGTSEHEVTAEVTSPLGGGLGYVYSARLRYLEPNTVYHYRVGSTADGWTPQSGSFAFRTSSRLPCESFTVVAVGDVRGESYLEDWGIVNVGSQWETVFNRLVDDSPDFVIIPGDLVDDGQDLPQWKTLFNQGLNHYPYVPVMPAFGNHDDGGGTQQNYELLYTLPKNNVPNEQYYYFEYGNALFIAFNSQETETYAAQYAWIEEVLKAKPATWKVIYLHHPVWTTTPGETQAVGCVICGHPPNENDQNDLIIDLVDRYDIDLVIGSHNHFYERSEPMRGGGSHASKVEPAPAYRGTAVGTRDGSGRVPTWGSMYIVTGGGGATLVPLAKIDEYTEVSGGQKWAPGQVTFDDQFHYMRFTFTDLELRMDVIRTADDSIADSAVVTKLAEYRITSCDPLPLDRDADGADDSVDCDDRDPGRYRGATEICGDDIDQDCTGGDLACDLSDGGKGDAGPGSDAYGDSDTGGGSGGDPAGGCGCGAAAPGWLVFLALSGLWRRSPRRRRRP